MRLLSPFCLLAAVPVFFSGCSSKAGQQPSGDGAADYAANGSGGNGGVRDAADSGLTAGCNGGDADCTKGSFPALLDAGPVCPGVTALDCGSLESYVDVVGDGDPIRLAYPMDPSCGSCGATTCQIWGRDDICCNDGTLTFAACAGPDGAGPCLDVRGCARYVDRNGKAWLGTITPGAPGTSAPLDVQATATFTDGATTLCLSIHIHICGSANYCGIIC